MCTFEPQTHSEILEKTNEFLHSIESNKFLSKFLISLCTRSEIRRLITAVGISKKPKTIYSLMWVQVSYLLEVRKRLSQWSEKMWVAFVCLPDADESPSRFQRDVSGLSKPASVWWVCLIIWWAHLANTHKKMHWNLQKFIEQFIVLIHKNCFNFKLHN